MTTAETTQRPTTGREAARFFGSYAKHFAAGAFATPTAADLDRAMAVGHWHWWDSGVAAVSNWLTRGSARSDFTGRKYQLPPGSQIITHIATVPGAELPRLDGFDWVFAYVDDANLTRQLSAQGREIRAIRVSSSSELIACWGRAGDGYAYSAVDNATLVKLPLTVPPADRDRILAEVKAVDGWCDDYPYYSDGSWDAVSLRGFNPADPMWGVKPAEMPKSWWAAHPDAINYSQCGWTTLAEKCPATVDLIKSIECFGGGLERVRLMRMAGRGGKGGSLSRHSDITDRASGTRNGQIIRFHIPLITHPRITMSAWNLRGERVDAHLPAWTLWYLDARKPHAVDNLAGVDRVHLVVDVLADSAARQAITRGREVASVG